MKRWILWGSVIAAAAAVTVGALLYYHHEKLYPSTNDAYLKADVVNVAAQVSGRVEAKPISDQMHVAKGQLLFRIDPQPFRYRLQEAEAKLHLARQTVQSEKAAVQAASADVASRQAQLDNADKQFHRIKRLVDRGARPESSLDDARAALKTARADLSVAKAKLHQARTELGVKGDANDRIQQALAIVNQAKLDLSHTVVKAACAGRISNLKLQVGDMISSGDPQFALVCTQRFWVYANFKETALVRVRPGQVANISVDMYPDHLFHGVVQSINPASGTAFSLLPPENATGNWVKVTQRVPVRILIVDATDRYPLRVQTSSEVTIDTGSGARPTGGKPGDYLTDADAMNVAAQKGLLPESAKVARE